MLFEDAADAGSHSDGMARYLEIDLAKHQSVGGEHQQIVLGEAAGIGLGIEILAQFGRKGKPFMAVRSSITSLQHRP